MALVGSDAATRAEVGFRSHDDGSITMVARAGPRARSALDEGSADLAFLKMALR
jgi:hypothetical protein